MPTINQALVFLKPHAASNPAARACMEAVFRRDGVQTMHETSLTGREIAASGAIDRHYAVNARVGTIEKPADLYVSPEARAKFQELFGEGWGEALSRERILSGLAAQRRLGLDGEAFNTLWARQKTHKLAGGLYVVFLPETQTYVLNGFYPSIREIFTHPDARVLLRVVEFAPATRPWSAFRARTIGATNPAAADPGSIRGRLHAEQAKAGLTVTYRENVIHASASPFEALLEKSLWLPDFPLARDPLGAAGITAEEALRWRDANPLVTVDGKPVPLVESLEDLDTDAVLARLADLRRAGALP